MWNCVLGGDGSDQAGPSGRAQGTAVPTCKPDPGETHACPSSLYPTGGGGGQSSDGGRATAVRLPREPTARTTQRRQVGTILPAKTALKRPPGPEITLRSVTRPSAVKVTRTCSREAKPEPVTVTGLALASFRRGSLGAGAPGAAGRTGGHTTTGTSLIR